MNDPRRTSLSERPVHLPRVADVVADQIRELIISGQLRDGERLPRLDSMLEDFGVSGPSMREALRMLESEGLITVRRGSIGGAEVHLPDAKTAAYTVALVMRSRDTEQGQVFQAMSLLEPVCAMLCARRPDRAETVVPELRKINASALQLIDDDNLTWNETMTSFHKAIVQRCGNDALSLLVGVLESILLVNVRAWAEASASHGTFPTRSVKLDNLKCHEDICDLIEAGEDLEVSRMMTDHIDGYLQVIYENKGIDPTQPVDANAIRANNWSRKRDDG